MKDSSKNSKSAKQSCATDIRLNRKLTNRARSLYRLPSRLTYSAVVDAFNQEKEITEFMTRRACDDVEKYQQFPFGPLPGRA